LTRPPEPLFTRWIEAKWRCIATTTSDPTGAIAAETSRAEAAEALLQSVAHVTSQSSNYSASYGDLVVGTGGASGINVTLPAPALNKSPVVVMKIDSSTPTDAAVTVLPHASETIEGASSYVLSVQYGSVVFFTDGTNWYPSAANIPLNPVTTNSKALGSQAAGSSGYAAKADHVHPTTGLVTSVAAGDTSIVVGGSSQAPTIETATLDVIVSDHPPAANWSNNSFKITNVASGTAATDAVAFGQLPADPWLPSDNGLLIANGDPVAFAASTTCSIGIVYLVKLTARSALTISNLWWMVEAVGSGTSSGSYVGLYALTGGSPLTGSADMGSLFTSTGPIETALTTPQALTAGESVWAAIVFNLATTQPTLFKGIGNVAGAANINQTVSNGRWVTAQGSGHTSLPSLTPSNNVTGTATFWCGGS